MGVDVQMAEILKTTAATAVMIHRQMHRQIPDQLK